MAKVEAQYLMAGDIIIVKGHEVCISDARLEGFNVIVFSGDTRYLVDHESEVELVNL